MRFTGKNYFVRFAEGFKLDYFHLREPCDYIMGIFVVFFQKLCNLIDAQLLLSILNKQLYDFCLFAFHVNITIILCKYIHILKLMYLSLKRTVISYGSVIDNLSIDAISLS